MGDVVAPPLGLATLAASLERARVPVRILDANAQGIGWSGLRAAIAWARDPLASATLAIILILAGCILLAANLGVPFITMATSWRWVLLMAGAVLLLQVLLRLVVPEWRRPVGGWLMISLILLAIGAGGVLGLGNTWPLILIAIGVAILVGGLLRPRS